MLFHCSFCHFQHRKGCRLYPYLQEWLLRRAPIIENFYPKFRGRAAILPGVCLQIFRKSSFGLESVNRFTTVLLCRINEKSSHLYWALLANVGRPHSLECSFKWGEVKTELRGDKECRNSTVGARVLYRESVVSTRCSLALFLFL